MQWAVFILFDQDLIGSCMIGIYMIQSISYIILLLNTFPLPCEQDYIISNENVSEAEKVITFSLKIVVCVLGFT